MLKRPISNPLASRHDHGLGPRIGGNEPTAQELRWTAWGFLMAAVWFGEPGRAPPTHEYLEALAEMRDLKLPAMSDVRPEFLDESAEPTEQEAPPC